MFKLDTKTMSMIAVGAVAFLAIIYYFFVYKKQEPPASPQNPSPPQQPVAAPQEQVAEKPTLLLIYADWCGACKAILPAWPQVEAALQGKVNVGKIESKDAAMASHTISHFPTIRLFPEGLKDTNKFIEFTGNRTPEAVVNFVMSGGKQ